ncbi:hypothetical protein RCL1_003681 [Eukaryota sp. TZLM3-RCL]
MSIQFALGQLFKATSNTKKQEKWTSVVNGMVSGSLAIGSRKPLHNLPVWTTPTVVFGGYATDVPKSGGPLLRHEAPKANVLINNHSQIESFSTERVRSLANSYFLTDAGQQELFDAYNNCNYRLDTCEEAALMIVGLLKNAGKNREAEDILNEIVPLFPQLRFFPNLIPSSPDYSYELSRPSVSFQPVSKTIQILSSSHLTTNNKNQYNAFIKIIPLCDLLVEIALLTTNEDDVPFMVENTLAREKYHEFTVGYNKLTLQEKNCKRLKKSYVIFIRTADQFFGNKLRKISRSTRSTLKQFLNSIINKRGRPGSQKHSEIRTKQKFFVERVDNFNSERVSVIAEISNKDPIRALNSEDLTALLSQIKSWKVKRIIERCRDFTLEELKSDQLFGLKSAEQIASFSHYFLSHVKASSLPDKSSQYLCFQLYNAFSYRRSVILFHLQTQVKIEEIPWVVAFLNKLHSECNQKSLVNELNYVKDLLFIWLNIFPYTQMPNKLVSALKQLYLGPEKIILIPELAVDIFEHSFADAFVGPFKYAVNRLQGTLYANYYNFPINFDAINSGQDLYNLCVERTKESANDATFTVKNGIIVEQLYILTTMNLIQLIDSFNLENELNLSESVLKCAKFILKCSLAVNRFSYKNAAYAWRQMLLMTSLSRHREEIKSKVCEIFSNHENLRRKFEQVFSEDHGPVFVGWVAQFNQMDWLKRKEKTRS